MQLSPFRAYCKSTSRETQDHTAQRKLKQRKQQLFIDGMRLDVESEEAVKQLTGQANLTAEVKRQFAIQFTGGNG